MSSITCAAPGKFTSVHLHLYLSVDNIRGRAGSKSSFQLSRNNFTVLNNSRGDKTKAILLAGSPSAALFIRLKSQCSSFIFMFSHSASYYTNLSTVRSESLITGCCEFMKMMLAAESGAERSVMDEDSDLEQIKGCQKLLNHHTCF